MKNTHYMWSDKAGYDHIPFDTNYSFISAQPVPNIRRKQITMMTGTTLWSVENGF